MVVMAAVDLLVSTKQFCLPKSDLTYPYICLVCSHTANFCSPISCTNHVSPTLGVVCGGTYCKVINSGESYRPYIFNCNVLKSSLLQQMAPDHLQAVCQPTRIYGNSSAHFFATQNRVISANVSFRQFVASDWVISPVHIWTELPINVQSILPAHFL